ncbi:MAG: RNase adapter RapZ [Deltaproteobacteria bacterium]|nr:RNase adapter RapZ [Deltaproteobacteria bacterium]MBW2595659.1 RNase adapter RapZ [Deltaproteobacteria bacterium]MBW2650409.1 RNase adapter RapZ [Deltaproteobacteria bacterium]
MKNLRIVIITGLSGSGKSTALRSLEDIGFFCVDNLPVMLLPKFLDMQTESPSEISKIALVMDLREKHFLEKHIDVLSRLRKKRYNVEILFLDTSNDLLLRRFSETRRMHPLSEGKTILENIELERDKLHELKEMAGNVIDTSDYSVHQLKEHVQRLYLAPGKARKLLINLISFGYRFGLPPDADIVMDVRFLPNPYFVSDLKEHNGNEKAVEKYVMAWDDTRQFLMKLYEMMTFLAPLYEKEGKSYLNIGIGCTGGKHRSVVILNQLAKYFTGRDYTTNVSHRDIDRA